MPPLDLSLHILGRPVKPVSLVFACTMLLTGLVSIFDVGPLQTSLWSDVLGAISFAVFGVFAVSWWFRSQLLGEVALLGAFFVWGSKFWVILLLYGNHAFASETLYLTFLWCVLAGGSWLLERADPIMHHPSRGERWTRH